MASLHRILLVFWSFIITVNGTLVKPRVYEIRGINSSCTSQALKIRLELNRNFKGVVYAKGFPLEKHCRSLGTGDAFVEISIDTSGCGVRLVSIDDEKFTYRVSLNIQTDRFLQQINDLEVSATCRLSFNDMVYPRRVIYNKQLSRTGRNKVPDVDRQDEIVNNIKTWMEIKGTSESSNINKVSVGEQTMILIKSFLPVNISANVIDCYAYDGTSDVAQKLIDENGCPLDETIMPSLEIIKYEDEDFSDENEIAWDSGTDASTRKTVPKAEKPSSKTKRKGGTNPRDQNIELLPENEKRKTATVQIMGTTFSAFKFPDTSNLHLRCSLQICRRACQRISCDSNSDSTQERTGKSVKTNRNQSSVIDKIEVFNSVEVVAPGIDSDGYSSNEDGLVDPGIKADESNFCLSASKMAFSFAILGAVFLCGVLAALWTVMRNQLRKANKIDGSEQVLVVRDSPMSFAHSRSKMHHNWTYS